MVLVLTFFTLLILITTLLPLSRCSHWIVRSMDFPRLQFAVSATVLLIADFLLLDTDAVLTQLLIAITTLCLFWQLWWILPYTLLWPKAVKTPHHHHIEKQISIITSNVLTSNRNSEALIQLVQQYQPDILVTLESDQWWQDQLDVLEKQMPYTIKCPQDNLYGMHVYSRLPFNEQEVCYLVEEDVPSIHASLKLRSGDNIRMHFVHPAPPSPTENTESAERDAELTIVARSVAQSDMPAIVTGDLNDVAWSSTTRLFRKISGLLDPRIGRGIFNTFHADYPLIRWPLDHVFHSHHFTLHKMQRLPSIGSDHFPLLTFLSYTPSQSTTQSTMQADVAEQKRSKKMAENQQVSKEDVPNFE